MIIGDIGIYDKKYEILKSLHPRFERKVFLEGSCSLKINPPAIKISKREYFAILEYGVEKVSAHKIDIHPNPMSFLECLNADFVVNM